MGLQHVEIDAVNFARMQALTTTGDCIPITKLLDCDGDETEDLNAAFAFTAGPTADGKWIAASVGDYTTPSKSRLN